MELCADAMRGAITAAPGHKLVVADLSNIEGRAMAWLAQEKWKIRAFRDFDEGKGEDLYKVSYGKSFSVDPATVTKDQRQIGKVQELMLQYEGGVGAYITGAATYRIDLEALAKTALRVIPGNILGQAKIMLDWHRKKRKKCPAAGFGLSEDAWTMCESFKLAWRDAHPATVQLWRDLDAAVRDAIHNPGTTYYAGMLKVRRSGAWLRIVLPSGRALCYPGPALLPEKQLRQKALDDMEDAIDQDASGRTVITYMGMNQYTRKWGRITTYSGKLAENCIQAIARDVMATNMPHIEAAGYSIALTVHDEIIAEAPDEPQYNPEHLAALLCAPPSWAPDMPLAAAGFEAYRYKKD